MLASLEINSVKTQGYTIENPAIYAGAADNQLLVLAQLTDSSDKKKFMIEGTLDKFENSYRWQTAKNGLILYYDPWLAADGNAVIIPKNDPLKFENMEFTNGKEFFAVKNKPENKLLFQFDKFMLENFTHFVFTEDQLMRGTMNGEVELQLKPSLTFLADLKIKNLAYAKDTLGNVAINVVNETPGKYEGSLSITGQNKVEGSVAYNQESENINGSIQLIDLNMHTVQGYLSDVVTSLKGQTKGEISVKGKLSDPILNGYLSISNTSFTLKETNTSYKINSSRIEMTNDQITFPKFTLTDEDGSKAQLTGYITLAELQPEKLHLDVSTDVFNLLNTKRKKDALYYGNVSLSSDISIRGTIDRPTVSSKLLIAPESKLTLVIPKAKVQVEDYKDIVEFVDLSDTTSTNPTVKVDSTIITELTGIQLNAQIEIDEKSTLKVIIDPITGDFIELRGDAYLSYELARNGTMNLTGTYSVKDGLYQMTYYNLIKREFEIEKGSSVTWYGDPFNATLNISAIYTTEASPLPIIQSQISESQFNAYKQAIPVDVVLKISEEMSSPSLNFDIRLPENAGIFTSGIVSAKIDQLNQRPSELNKQVFSLLILNRFIPEDNNSNVPGNTLGGSTRGSVSELITEQFNTLAGKYIKSVDVTINLDSYNDYSSGDATGRTDLEIGLSKAVFNERLVVSIESDFNLEGGEQTETNGNLGGFIGTAQVEYLLSEDGKYRMKVFRENEYAGIIDGNLTQTGVSFILTEDFKKLFGDKKLNK